jgi:hypothetical protein
LAGTLEMQAKKLGLVGIWDGLMALRCGCSCAEGSTVERPMSSRAAKVSGRAKVLVGPLPASVHFKR